jgi:hypothetical protein
MVAVVSGWFSMMIHAVPDIDIGITPTDRHRRADLFMRGRLQHPLDRFENALLV